MRARVASLIVTVSLMGTVAGAQEPTIPKCGPRADMTSQLAAKWGEMPVVMGTAGTTAFIWFANPVTGTWTAAAVETNGQLCILTSGNNYRMVPNA